jgi:hypothetical protein
MAVFTPIFTEPSRVLSERFTASPPSRPSVRSIDPILPVTDERPAFVTTPFAKITNSHYFDKKNLVVCGPVREIVKFPIKGNGQAFHLPALADVMKAIFADASAEKQPQPEH